jgi:HlyD family secretion protein
MKKFLRVFLRLMIILVILAAVVVGGVKLVQGNQVQQARAILAGYKLTQVGKGTMTATVSGTGNVHTYQSATLAWKISGRVDVINVKVGDVVKADQVLASLALSSLPQNYIQSQADLIAAQTDVDNLKTVDQLAVATAEEAVTDAANALQTAKDAYSYLKNRIGSQVEIDYAKARILQMQQNLDFLQDELTAVCNPPRCRGGAARNAQILAQIAQASRTLQAGQANLDYFQGNEAATSDLEKAESQVTLAQARLQKAQDDLATLKGGPTDAKVVAAQAKIAVIQDKLAQKDLTAPFDGTITAVNNLPNDLVKSGKLAFRIDVTNAMVVDLQISELDVNKVKVGQAAQITFDGIPDKTYNATVDKVGNIGATSGGVVNFTVTLAMTDADSAVKSGMSASATILVTELNDVLFVPSQAVRKVGNRSMVYVIDTGSTTAGATVSATPIPAGPSGFAGIAGAISGTNGLRPVTVQVGMTSDTSTQIISGLKEGDKLVLNPPATTNLFGFGGFGGGAPGGDFGGGPPAGGFQGRPAGGFGGGD